MVARVFCALGFLPHTRTKFTPFESHCRNEANIVLRNLIKKSSLKIPDGTNVLKQKLQF